MQPVELRRRHADVDRTLGEREDVDAGVVEQRAEILAERIVEDWTILPPQLVLRRVGIIHIVGRVREGHVGELTSQHLLDIGQDRGVAA